MQLPNITKWLSFGICLFFFFFPHMVERTPNDVLDTHTLYAHREAFMYVHNGIKTIWLALCTFHILTRMSGHANQLAVHVLVFTLSYYIAWDMSSNYLLTIKICVIISKLFPGISQSTKRNINEKGSNCYFKTVIFRSKETCSICWNPVWQKTKTVNMCL